MSFGLTKEAIFCLHLHGHVRQQRTKYHKHRKIQWIIVTSIKNKKSCITIRLTSYAHTKKPKKIKRTNKNINLHLYLLTLFFFKLISIPQIVIATKLSELKIRKKK
jgi:hypothetical protein